MTENTSRQLEALSRHLAARRELILQAWRKAADADPVQTTVHSLTRTQFNDHIPEVLDAFEQKLSARPGGIKEKLAEQDTKREEVKHGLQRWQQGYRLPELMHEWGHLQLCLFDEIEGFAAIAPGMEREAVAAAHRELIRLTTEGVSQSAGQYSRLAQAEAAGHVIDLKRALEHVQAIERRRSQVIHQAVHDLRGNVQTVTTAVDGLNLDGLGEEDKVAFASMLQQGIGAVSEMLEDLMALARLEAGQDTREIKPFDAAKVLSELSQVCQPVAQQKDLFLQVEGPAELRVEGDAWKMRRIVQNLAFNAIKYTEKGGVTLGWGERGKSWWLEVKDTGPGILLGPGSPMLEGLKDATTAARETEARATGGAAPAPGVTAAAGHGRQQVGEGIGLSIVKRLCDLLDASLEMTSDRGHGTTFRVTFPRDYQA